MYNFALKKFDFRGRWFQTPKNRGWSKKTQGRTALNNGGGSLPGSLAVGSFLQVFVFTLFCELHDIHVIK